MCNSFFSVGRIKGGMQIEQLTVRIQGLKAMRTAFRDHQHTSIIVTKLLGVPLHESRRPSPQIHCNVPDAPPEAAYEFHLGVRSRLVMHAAYGTYRSRA